MSSHPAECGRGLPPPLPLLSCLLPKIGFLIWRSGGLSHFPHSHGGKGGGVASRDRIRKGEGEEA